MSDARLHNSPAQHRLEQAGEEEKERIAEAVAEANAAVAAVEPLPELVLPNAVTEGAGGNPPTIDNAAAAEVRRIAYEHGLLAKSRQDHLKSIVSRLVAKTTEARQLPNALSKHIKGEENGFVEKITPLISEVEAVRIGLTGETNKINAAETRIAAHAEREKQRAEQERLAAANAASQKALDEARAKDEPIEPTPSPTPQQAADQVAASFDSIEEAISSESSDEKAVRQENALGKGQRRSLKGFTETDPNRIPRHFLIVDRVAVNRALNDGETIDGIEAIWKIKQH